MDRLETHRAAISAALAALLLFAAGCGSMVRSAARPMIENLSSSIMKQRDVELVRQGAPAYLLLVDGLVEGSPDDADTLSTAAGLYSAYISAFVIDSDMERAKILTEKAKNYAVRAFSIRNAVFAKVHDKPFEQFQAVLPTLKKGDLGLIHLVISTWASYIQAHSGNWDNLADIAKVEAMTRRLLGLDETFGHGSGHLVLGVLETILPAALGGRPEDAKKHFERAMELSEGKFLMTPVMYAEHYAKTVFDRGLYESLLKKALETPDDVYPDLILVNVVAKKKAAKMLAEADKIF